MSKSFRFNVLSNDVDMDNWSTLRPIKEEKVKPEPIKKVIIKPKEKTVKKKQEKESLKALAFGNPTSKPKKKTATANEVNPGSAKSNGGGSATTKKNNKSNGVVCNGVGQHEKQKNLSEDWKNRDQQFVEEENERELREALMLSKLDYEANKEVYLQGKQDSNKNISKAKKKKKEKPITVSLSEFNTMDARKISRVNDTDNSKPSKATNDGARDDNFFTDVDTAVRNTIVKESRQKQYTEQINKQKSSKNGSSNTGSSSRTSDNATLLVPVSEVEKRDFEIQALRLEVESLKDQLEKVKLRNKKLCEVLGTAEMRSVGEVVIELGKVSKARDELSVEVATLSGQLEQEKTKVSQLQEKHRKK